MLTYSPKLDLFENSVLCCNHEIFPEYEPITDFNQPNVLHAEDRNEEIRIIEQQPKESLNVKWISLMVETPNPIREKIALFWHHHIPSTGGKNVDQTQLLLEIFRKQGLRNLRDLLVDLISTPAIMRFLDLDASSKSSPNENFAREFLELYTLGEGNFSLNDVKEAARAFTGRRYDNSGYPYAYYLDKTAYDDGFKSILGRTSNFNAESVIDLVLEKRQTAYHVTRSLLKFLVSDNPTEDLIRDCGNTYYDSNYEMIALLTAIQTHTIKSRFNKVKTPVELLVNFQRQTGLRTIGLKSTYFFLRYTGQDIFNPPNAAGWPGGQDWLRGERLLHRLFLPTTLLSIANRKYPKKSIAYKIQSRIFQPNIRKYRYYADAQWDEEYFYQKLKDQGITVSEWLLGYSSKNNDLASVLQSPEYQYI